MRHILTIGLVALTIGAAPAPATAKTSCHEDQKCWSWSTMGNKQRGIYVNNVPHRIVVTRCEYRALRMLDMIDRKRTPRLRGDHRARYAKGCKRSAESTTSWIVSAES
jgi:hypothetical protein